MAMQAGGMKWSNCHCERNEMERGNRSVAELNEVNLYCAAINMRLLRSCLPRNDEESLTKQHGNTDSNLIIMAYVSTYLNFSNKTEEAFNFYKSVFGGEFMGDIMRFGDVPPSPNIPHMPESDKNLVMHVALPILGGHLLMGSDAPESMNFRISTGNNMYIMLSPDTRAETRRLFNALSKEGNIEMELQDMFWGDYYGSCSDKFGVQWMFNCSEKGK